MNSLREVFKMKEKHGCQFITGFVLGAVLFGGSVAFAANITAIPTTGKIFVNGLEAKFEAYNINGGNYFKLRDIAKAVDFAVDWDAATGAIRIYAKKPYSDDTQMATLPQAVTAAAPAAVPEQEQPVMSIDEMKAELIRLTNIERSKAGVPMLEELPALMECAQLKADDMGGNSYYGHDSPVYGTPMQMIKERIPNVQSCAENIAPWTKTPAEAFEGWVDSPTHYKNMVNPKYTRIGVGILEGAGGGYWWVQQFI